MEEKHRLEFMFMQDKVVISGRIAKVKDLSLELTKIMLDKYDYYIVSEEGVKGGTPALHHHFVVIGDIDTKIITADIKRTYPDAVGNKFFSVSVAENPKQLIKYTLKEGKFLYKGFTKEFIEDAHKLSKKKEGMKEQFVKLEEQLMLKKINFKKFVEEYIKLKVQHSQPIYDNHLIAYFKRIALQIGELHYDSYSDSLISRVFYLC